MSAEAAASVSAGADVSAAAVSAGAAVPAGAAAGAAVVSAGLDPHPVKLPSTIAAPNTPANNCFFIFFLLIMFTAIYYLAPFLSMRTATRIINPFTICCQ